LSDMLIIDFCTHSVSIFFGMLFEREKPLDMKVVFECARTHDKRLVECLVYKVGFHAPNCMLTVVQLHCSTVLQSHLISGVL
jgi:hypothetical protein